MAVNTHDGNALAHLFPPQATPETVFLGSDILRDRKKLSKV